MGTTTPELRERISLVMDRITRAPRSRLEAEAMLLRRAHTMNDICRDVLSVKQGQAYDSNLEKRTTMYEEAVTFVQENGQVLDRSSLPSQFGFPQLPIVARNICKREPVSPNDVEYAYQVFALYRSQYLSEIEKSKGIFRFF